MWIEATSSVHPIHSETTGLRGWVDVEVASDGSLGPGAEAVVELPVDLLSSGNPFEARELRRRIDAGRYPTIEGRLTELEIDDAAAGTYRACGEVTFRGRTGRHCDTIEIRHLDEGGLAIGGESTFDIRDFGMEPPRILMLRVHPTVTVRIAVVALLPDRPDDAP